MATRLRNYLKRHSITPILTFPHQGGRNWIPAFAGMIFHPTEGMAVLQSSQMKRRALHGGANDTGQEEIKDAGRGASRHRGEQRVHEVLGVEGGQVIEGFSGADEHNRHL